MISLVPKEEFKSLTEDSANAIIDVRSKLEYFMGNIDGSQNIDMMSKDFAEKVSNLDKEAHYLLYCRTDNRSQVAAKQMEELGFKQISVLKGGYSNW